MKVLRKQGKDSNKRRYRCGSGDCNICRANKLRQYTQAAGIAQEKLEEQVDIAPFGRMMDGRPEL